MTNGFLEEFFQRRELTDGAEELDEKPYPIVCDSVAQPSLEHYCKPCIPPEVMPSLLQRDTPEP